MPRECARVVQSSPGRPPPPAVASPCRAALPRLVGASSRATTRNKGPPHRVSSRTLTSARRSGEDRATTARSSATQGGRLMTSVTTPVGDSGDTASEVAVRARDVARHYGEGETAVHALRGVDLDVGSRHLTGLIGPSGSGKSTLMHILAGLDKPSSGEVVVAGIDIGALDDTELTKLRRDHIGFIFQFFNLLPMLTAAENIALPLKLAGEKPDQKWFDELVEKVGLGDRLT